MIERNVHTPGRKPKKIPTNLLILYENHTTADLAENLMYQEPRFADG